MSQTPPELAAALLATRRTADEAVEAARKVYLGTLTASPNIKEGNFTAFSGDDVQFIFDLTDQFAFGGGLRRLLEKASGTLSFQASKRLTRSGGVTRQFRPRGMRPVPLLPGCRYEIALSSPLLFQTFQDVSRPVHVSGLLCADRLEAAQRVVEHEAVHLLEMLARGKSSCAQGPFQAVAEGVFGHTEHKHNLVTQRERAREKHGLKVGDLVAFAFEGQPMTGLINRITQRATILVENPKGQLYTSGKRYLKYYVPLGMLSPINGGNASSLS